MPSIQIKKKEGVVYMTTKVLNLVINGMPSILEKTDMFQHHNHKLGFKPCYKWNAFNTALHAGDKAKYKCFKPCYKWNAFNTGEARLKAMRLWSFKPCYKWNAFNTYRMIRNGTRPCIVLNLVINGMPSIL